MIRLKHLNRSGRWPSGRPRVYYRPKGQKGIPLPDLPMDHPKFLAAYVAAAGHYPEVRRFLNNINRSAAGSVQ